MLSIKARSVCGSPRAEIGAKADSRTAVQIPLSDVAALYSEGQRVMLRMRPNSRSQRIFGSMRFAVSHPLKELEEMVAGREFVRVNHGLIIAITEVERIEEWCRRHFRIIALGASRPIPVSRRRASEVLQMANGAMIPLVPHSECRR